MKPLRRQTPSSIIEVPILASFPGGVRVKVEAPLSAMFGYIGDLRTMTSGRGQFSMEFSHYAACPKNISDEVIKAAKEREEAKKK